MDVDVQSRAMNISHNVLTLVKSRLVTYPGWYYRSLEVGSIMQVVFE